jgi:hypothetical protein
MRNADEASEPSPLHRRAGFDCPSHGYPTGTCRLHWTPNWRCSVRCPPPPRPPVTPAAAGRRYARSPKRGSPRTPPEKSNALPPLPAAAHEREPAKHPNPDWKKVHVDSGALKRARGSLLSTARTADQANCVHSGPMAAPASDRNVVTPIEARDPLFRFAVSAAHSRGCCPASQKAGEFFLVGPVRAEYGMAPWVRALA